LRVILVYTHDSIGLGEDGPTHQPIEHLSSLRAIPHMNLWRPCDAAETAVAWTLAIERQARRRWCSPASRCRSNRARRRSWPTSAAAAYVLLDCSGTPECLVIRDRFRGRHRGAGVTAANAAGRRVRLVSMPSTEAFDAQDAAYRESVLPRALTRRLAVGSGCDPELVALRGQHGSRARHRSLRRLGQGGRRIPTFLVFTADNIAQQIRQLLEE